MTRATLDRFRQAGFLGWPNRFSPSSREILAAAGLIVAATAVGRIAWSGEVLALPAAILFPMFWAFAPTRLVSALVSMAYFLAASRDLPQGASTYLEINKALSVALWLAASASFVLLHTVLWTSKPRLHRALRYGLAALAMSSSGNLVATASEMGTLLPSEDDDGSDCLLLLTTTCYYLLLLLQLPS